MKAGNTVVMTAVTRVLHDLKSTKVSVKVLKEIVVVVLMTKKSGAAVGSHVTQSYYTVLLHSLTDSQTQQRLKRMFAEEQR